MSKAKITTRTDHEAYLRCIWHNVKRKCSGMAASNGSHERFYVRGIRMCKAWHDSFEQFVVDMAPGYSPGMRLARKDEAQWFTPDNCYWEETPRLKRLLSATSEQ